MNRLVKLVVLSVLACAAVPESLHAQDATAVALDRIYREYGAQKGATDVAVLVRLDQQLRNLVPYYTWQNRPWLSANYFDTKYKEIGLAPALFEPSVLTYSGKLLLEAHTKNARSPLRSSTLYSTVFGAAGETSNGLPSTSAAEAYVREFPNGPFVLHAYMGLAHFYDDLYKVITLEQIGQRIDYKYDCYRRYLSARPLSEQQRAVQELGIRYYEQVVRLDPGNQDEARYLRELRQGSRDSGWFYCGD